MRHGTAVQAAALGAAAFAVAFALAAQSDRMGLTFEFPEYADVAREIARGNGIRGHVLYPSVLAWGDAAGVEIGPGGTYPVMNRHPGFAAALAPFVGLLGGGDLAVHAGLAAFFGLWVAISHAVLAGIIGRRLALLAALLLLANPAFLRFLVPGGYADVLFAALVLPFLAWGARMIADGDARPGRWALLGLLGAAAWSVRFNFGLFPVVIGAAVLLVRRDRAGVVAVAALAAGYVAGTLPLKAWHAWTFATTESPPTLWNLLDGFPGYAAPWKQYRMHGIADLLDTGLWRPWLTDKVPYFLYLTAKSLPGAFLYVALFPFLLAALVMPDADPRRRRFLGVSAAAAAAMAVVMAGLRFEEWPAPGGRSIGLRYLVWFAPVLAGFGLHGLSTLLSGRPPLARRAAWAAVIGVQVAWMAAHWGPLDEVYKTRGRFEDLPAARALAEADAGGRTARDRPIATNVPAQVGWYLDRPAVLLPATPPEMAFIRERHPIAGYLFTELDIGEPLSYGAWRDVLGRPEALAPFLEAQGLEVAWRDADSVLLLPRQPRTAGSPGT